jgi:hypothetical protein
MLQLEFSKVTATLENVNLRTEKNGPDKVPAADLKLSVATSADVLAFFSPTLKAFLFNESGPRDLADGLPLRDTHMVFPMQRDEEMAGADVILDYGLPGSEMMFGEVKVNQFRITPMEGGSVIVDMRVQCKPTPEQIAKLYTLQEMGVTLSLDPAELPKLKEDAA